MDAVTRPRPAARTGPSRLWARWVEGGGWGLLGLLPGLGHHACGHGTWVGGGEGGTLGV